MRELIELVPIIQILDANPNWKRSIFPKCPVCGESGGQPGHKNCREDIKGKCWINITNGKKICDSCGDDWSVENTCHHCSCGAIFEGGEIWQGMEQHIEVFGTTAWMRRIGISKGTLETKVTGFWKVPRITTLIQMNTNTYFTEEL